MASILSLLREIDSCHQSPLSRDTADFLLVRLSGAIRHTHQILRFIESSPQFSNNDVVQVQNLARELQTIETLFKDQPVFTPSSYRAPIAHTGAVGRPSFDISREQIMLLRSCFFTWTAIAGIIGVSRWTIYRRVNSLDIPDTSCLIHPLETLPCRILYKPN